MTPHTSFAIGSINKIVNTHFIERKEDNHSMLSSDRLDDISKSNSSMRIERSNKILIESEESEDDESSHRALYPILHWTNPKNELLIINW